MTDTVIGVVCTFLGATLAVVGVAVLAFGGYTLAIGHGGGWWIVEMFYVLMGAGLAVVICSMTSPLVIRLNLQTQSWHFDAVRAKTRFE